MNNLILNREYRLPDDGWYHIAPLGEFSHAGAGVIQVSDVAPAGRHAVRRRDGRVVCLVQVVAVSRDC